MILDVLFPFIRLYRNRKVSSINNHRLEKDGRILYDGPAMLVWPRGVFHRIRTGEDGSASLNFAVHYEGFDIQTNFNIYDLNTASGRFRTIRDGHEDQIKCRGDGR